MRVRCWVFSLCKAENLVCPEVVKDWWFSFR